MRYLTRNEMQKADREATSDIGLMRLMENAGVKVAEFARQQLEDAQDKKVVVLVGKGNNGGDGLVAGRHLHNWGSRVTFIQVPRELMRASQAQAKLVRQARFLKVDDLDVKDTLADADLVIDALFGYNLEGDPREPYAALIEQANGVEAPLLALDVPSGLDATTGERMQPCIQETWTLTLAIPKMGLKECKEVYVADIGIPPKYFTVPNFFHKESILKL